MKYVRDSLFVGADVVFQCSWDGVGGVEGVDGVEGCLEGFCSCVFEVRIMALATRRWP